MTEEEKALLKSYKSENEKTYAIANTLDAANPELPGAFTGTPSERIARQLKALGAVGFARTED